MLIKLAHPVGFSKIGGRSNNEDTIYPLENEATANDQLFVVCDGMGGHSNGEIASKIAASGFAEYQRLHLKSNSLQSSVEIYAAWDNALIEVENQFEEYIKSHPESSGMGTTLCICHFNTMCLTIGHIGDSRIYQIRQNQIIFKSEDHSMVNEKVRSGEITAEEAQNYPGRNIITRAIQGAKSPTKIEYNLLTDIQKGDNFFICTDGVLEQINDRILVEIVSTSDFTVQQKVDAIIEKCQNITKDNYSGYLIEIEDVETNSLPKNQSVLSTTNEEEGFDNKNDYLQNKKPKTEQIPQSKPSFFRKSKDVLVGLSYAFGGLFFLFIGWMVYSELTEKELPQPTIPTKIEKPSNQNLENVKIEEKEDKEVKKPAKEKPVKPKKEEKPKKENKNKQEVKPPKTVEMNAIPAPNPQSIPNIPLKIEKTGNKPTPEKQPTKQPEDNRKPKEREIKNG
jgi:serine/threonine protein phosphatase PrpC